MHLGKKLQLKTGQDILLLNAPVHVVQLLSEEGYTVRTEQEKNAPTDAIQLFVHSKAELQHHAEKAVAGLRKDGILWIAYPKKSSGVISDITRDEGWKTMADLGYEGVRQVAIDEVWSSLRFKPKSERKEPSRMGVDYPGIDRVKKEVIPPADLQDALDAAGLNEKFQNLSFTGRKEYVVAVLDAKRPETRASRIVKTIEQVAAK